MKESMAGKMISTSASTRDEKGERLLIFRIVHDDQTTKSDERMMYSLLAKLGNRRRKSCHMKQGNYALKKKRKNGAPKGLDSDLSS